MFFSFRKLFLLGIVVFAACRPTVSEEPARSGADEPRLTTGPRLPHGHPLTLNSGYIFAGTVRSVEQMAPRTPGVATVQINFHIDEAIRGVRTGQMLAIREWAGLWNSGERYRPGERVLLFLYPPSKLGLTSPVGGAMGRFAVGPRGRVRLPPGRIGLLPRPRTIQDETRGKTEFSPRN